MKSIREFFSGRYGIDALWYFLLAVFFLLRIGALFASAVPCLILNVLSVLFILLLLFRMFSRNIPARRRENERFIGFFRSIGNEFVLMKNRWKDRKTHVYRKCPSCKAVLRLKKIPGEHTVVCPKCSKRIGVIVK